MTPEELATPVEELFGGDLLYPELKKHRWHCSKCGRWVPFPTVRKVPVSGPDWIDEHEYTGECRTHGRVDVVWPEG